MSKPSRFAVVTPYFKEPRKTLQRCIDSVKRQTVAGDHFFVSDGFPQDWLDDAGVKHIRLGHAHRDYGNTPRGIGALLAVSQHYDGIGLLDADNWYDDDHIEVCCAAANSVPGASIDLVIARRRILRIDGTPTEVPDEPGHVDTSCYWFLEGSFHLIHYWLTMPVEVAPLCDRIFYSMIRARDLVMRGTRKITVNYTYPYESLYRTLGEAPPPGAKPTIDTQPIFKWLRDLGARERRLVAERCGVDLVPMATHAHAVADAPRPTRRNDPCPCGSGRKYKHCHGAL